MTFVTEEELKLYPVLRKFSDESLPLKMTIPESKFDERMEIMEGVDNSVIIIADDSQIAIFDSSVGSFLFREYYWPDTPELSYKRKEEAQRVLRLIEVVLEAPNAVDLKLYDLIWDLGFRP